MLKATAVVITALVVGDAVAAAKISVHSDAIDRDGRIASRNSAYGANRSPQVSWTAVRGAKSYVVILDDPDAAGPAPFVHWLVWNIPPSLTHLGESDEPPPGAVEGRNGRGGTGHWGPHPPSGVHHYHLEVFALDTVLPLGAGADRDQLASAMREHVVASGEVVGLFGPPTH